MFPFTPSKVITAAEIIYFQQIVRKVPVTDNVLEYAVKLATKTPSRVRHWLQIKSTSTFPLVLVRVDQFLVVGAKCHALLHGKYSPDIEDVRAVAKPILRHRLVKNYKAEAEGVSTEQIIDSLL